MEPTELEGAICAILTEALGKLVIDRDALVDVGRRLAQEITSGARKDDRGRTFSPDQFTLTFHPGQIALFASQLPQVQASLADGLADVLRQHGLTLIHPPHVTLASDPTLASREIRAISWHSRDPLTFSAMMDTPAEPTDEPPPGAFLVVDGKRHFPLSASVISIGRRLDNHLVLDDPHVSRTHAQLRSQRGKFVLVDLNSTGGTRVNGNVIRQHTLKPGDVISIAGIELIYGQDPSGPPVSTPPYAPPFAQPSDRERITPLNLRFAQDLRSPTKELPKKPEDDAKPES
jgi:FHA domain/FhaA, N-terminal domain